MAAKFKSKLSKIALVFCATTWFAANGMAQDLQIMVNGPWAYVKDPNHAGKIVIIGARSKHHGPAMMFSGEDADQFPKKINSTTLGLGSYDVIFQTTCKDPAPPPSVFSVDNIPVDKVKALIAGPGDRYSISLPEPCSYSYARRSWSKVDSNLPIKAPEASYTTWMVLHYSLPTSPQALVTGSTDDQTVSYKNKPIDFTSVISTNPKAISIVLGSDELLDTDTDCDSTSNMSVRDTGALFEKTLHVHFPKILQNGSQSHEYLPQCVDASSMLKKTVSLKMLHLTDVIESYFERPSRESLASARTALTTLKNELNSNSKIPAVVDRELSSLDLRGRNDPLPTSGNTSTSHPRRLPQTAKFISRLSAGAGDCRGTQFYVTTVP